MKLKRDRKTKIEKIILKNKTKKILFVVLFFVFSALYFSVDFSFLSVKEAQSAIVPDPNALIQNYTGPIIANPASQAAGAATGGGGGVWSSAIQYLLSLFPRMFLFVLYSICWIFYSITYGLVFLSEGILKIFFDPAFITSLGGFTTVDFVRNTAQIIANLCNMLFLFILLYIAIGTMLGIGNTKKLLVKLVIAALLTNFSLVISGIIIDFSQVLMHSFFSTGFSQSFNPGTKILSNLQQAWGVGESFSISELFTKIGDFIWSKTFSELINDMIKIFGLIVFSLILVTTLITITTLLIIRIVVLWILLIVSPAAFTSSVLSQTERYWKMWLENLTKYAFSGPILIFFLWLAIRISEKVSNNQQLSALSSNVPNGEELRYTFYVLLAKNATVVFQLLVLILVVWAGIILANEFHIKGAKSLSSLIDKAKNSPGKLLSRIGRVSNFGGDLISGSLYKQSEKFSGKANLARSEGKTDRAEIFSKVAKKFSGGGDSVNKWKNRVVKALSVSDPQKTKKLFSAYLDSENKKYEEHSEESIKSFWKNAVKKVSLEKRRLINHAAEAEEAKLNFLNTEFVEKNNEKVKILNSLKNLRDDSSLIKKIESEKNNITLEEEKLKTLETNKILLPGENPQSRLEKITKQKENVQKLKDALEKEELDLNKIRGEKKNLLEKKEKVDDELLSIGTSLSEISEKDQAKRKEIVENYEKIIEDSSISVRDRNTFHIAKEVGKTLGEENSLIQNARKIAEETKSKELSKDMWVQEKIAKDVKEASKEIDDKNYSFDEVKGMIKSGYGSPAMRTALFKKLGSSSKHFGDLISELKKDLGGEEKAIDFLKEKYTEPEVLKVLRTVDEESRKSKNLSQIGRVTYDARIGRMRFSTEKEKINVLKNFAKSMTPKDLNKTHKQSFTSQEGLEALALGPDWVSLAKNPDFKKLMPRDLKESFASKKNDFVKHFKKANNIAAEEAFIKIIGV